MRKLIIALLLLVAFNANALRCGNKIILVGDSVLKVLENCGRPLYSQIIIKNNKLIKLFIYKKNGREQRVFLRHANVIGVN